MQDKQTAKENARQLMRRMTTEEKVDQLRSQLIFADHYSERDFKVGHFRNIAHFMHCVSPKKLKPSDCARAINEDTKKSIEASRLKIPVLQNGEALHGAQWGNATCFPQAIGMAASFDPKMVFEIGCAVAKELRAVGVRQVFAPMINIVRDCRWGRTEESYGEDVCLTSHMAVAYVKALETNGIVSTPKHFVDNYADGGRDSNESHSSWRTLREVYLEPFRACVEEGGARSIMSAYNSVDGVPCTASKKLLTDILRKEWGFEGFTVSDYGAVYGVFAQHQLTGSYTEAQAMALEAGLDVELQSGYGSLLELVNSGRISRETLNRAVERVLTCKFELGLFDEPFVDPAEADQIVRCTKHRALARQAARESIVLLKNKDGALPLRKNRLKTVGVFGPGANAVNVGGYSGPYGGWHADDAKTPYQALREFLGENVEILNIADDKNIAPIAQKCDVALYFSSSLEGEGADRCSLKLPSQKVTVPESSRSAVIIDQKEAGDITVDQEKILRELAASGTKTIVILINGAPVEMDAWKDGADAILEAWYPGEEGSGAIADVLFGGYNPGGKLPITFPKSVGQLPLYYSVKPSGRGYGYVENDGAPLFPFGFGLSYTSFAFGDFSVDETGAKSGRVRVRFTMQNTGGVGGDEVAQLYLHGRNGGVVRPLKELKAFRRVSLAPGETKTVVLELGPREFGFWNQNLVFETGHGDYDIMLGNSSDHILYTKTVSVG